MKLTTIEMPKQEARQAFLEYRRAVRERHNEEDAQIMRCYKALAGGHRVINLNDVMRRGGQDKNLCPKLAIARADERQMMMNRRADGALQFYPVALRWDRNTWEYKGRVFRFPANTLPPVSLLPSMPDWVATVPIIPPELRPAHALTNYHILWEANWEKVPPRDPALLKLLGGSLYAVLAVWDLTAVERAVLGITRN